MIHTYALTEDNQLVENIDIAQLKSPEIKFFWADFEKPSSQETMLLKDYFHFHPIAIENCMHYIQRPNMSFYDDVLFFVLHSLNQQTFQCAEVDVFVGGKFVVSYHLESDPGIEKAKQKMRAVKDTSMIGPLFILHSIMNELVDHYFPIMHEIEDKLIEFEENETKSKKIIEEVYEIRSDLIRLRKTIFPMRDLLYRVINSERIKELGKYQHYFADIYDHLLKLADMLTDNQEITADMRDNFMSIQSNKMNSIMMTLTVITTIFMPLTFIVGVYGMNFDNMPELHWKYGYYAVLCLMGLLAILMSIWFNRKGWLFNK